MKRIFYKIHKFFYKIKSIFLDFFGNLRITKIPPFIYYDDIVYKMTGEHIRDIMKIAKPGDVIIRGYDSYLDSMFVPSSRKYSHAGLIVDNGKVIHSISPKVTKTDIIDFSHCDRIAIVRAKKYTKSAIKMAEKFLKKNTPYDFAFTNGQNSLYCFELAAYCYPKLKIEKKEASLLNGLIKKSEKVYLSDSFFESPDFTLIYEYNPKYNIDYIEK